MFDFGEKLYEKPASFKLWPTAGTFTALVDADLLPYIVGYTTEEASYAKALLRVEDGEYSHVTETPEYEDAADQLDWTINHWIQSVGADSAILYVTDSPGNFRLKVAFTREYKGQRPPEKPPFFYELKAHLIENHKAVVAYKEEADDLIVTEMHTRHKDIVDQGAELGSDTHKRFSDVIAVSSDKDLRICPGWHYDPTKDNKVWIDVLGWLDPVYKTREVINYEYRTLCVYHDLYHEGCEALGKAAPCEPARYVKGKNKGKEKRKRIKNGLTTTQYVDKLRGGGLKFFYAQLLMGDDADNYPGAPGVGMTRAFEVLNPCKTEEEMYNAVLQEYLKVYGPSSVATNYRGGSCTLTHEQRMVEQGRLAHMRRSAGEVWRADLHCPDGEDAVWRS